jgi:GT2 family glycosyltransferase
VSDVLPVHIVHLDRPRACIETVKAFVASTVPVTTTVYDNGSSSEDLAELKGGLAALPVELVEIGHNRGWTGAANTALNRFLDTETSEWCVLAPHDARPHPSALAEMLVVARDRAAIVGADRGDGAVGRYRWWRGPYIETSDESPDWVLGHCLLISRRFLEAAGLEDERLWTYLDEVDMCLRARRLGWEVRLAKGAYVENAGAPVAGTPLVAFLCARNSIVLAETHHGGLRAATRAAIVVASSLRWMVTRNRPGTVGASGAPMWAIAGASAWALRRFGPPPKTLLPM